MSAQALACAAALDSPAAAAAALLGMAPAPAARPARMAGSLAGDGGADGSFCLLRMLPMRSWGGSREGGGGGSGAGGAPQRQHVQFQRPLSCSGWLQTASMQGRAAVGGRFSLNKRHGQPGPRTAALVPLPSPRPPRHAYLPLARTCMALAQRCPRRCAYACTRERAVAVRPLRTSGRDLVRSPHESAVPLCKGHRSKHTRACNVCSRRAIEVRGRCTFSWWW